MKTKTFIRCTLVAALVSISGAQVATAASTHPTLIAMDDMSKGRMPTDGMSKDGMSKDGMSKDGMMKDGMMKDGMSKDDIAKDSLKRNHLLRDSLKKCKAMKKAGTMTPDDTTRCDKLQKEWNDLTNKNIEGEKDELKSDGMKKDGMMKK